MYFNTVYFLYDIIFNINAPCDLFTSVKSFVYHSFNNEGYFSHYIGITVCFLHITLLLGIFICLQC